MVEKNWLIQHSIPFILSLSIGIPVASMVPNHHILANQAFSTAMTSMHTAMELVQMTDNIDTDFAAMMIPHHQGAIAIIKSGQSSQALVYVSNAVPTGDGLANLEPLGKSGIVAHLVMGAPGSSAKKPATTVTVNNLGVIDLLEAAVTGLQPKSMYQLVLAERSRQPYGKLKPLANFQTNPSGAAIVTTLGPIGQVVKGDTGTQSRQYLVIVPLKDDIPGMPVQIQLQSVSK
ncbi:MAG: DUF305 domain-containing protein [Rhizonema sp. PD37]|nr:DUF305 domain-containing protein [Rhizonema sp. PD37]